MYNDGENTINSINQSFLRLIDLLKQENIQSFEEILELVNLLHRNFIDLDDEYQQLESILSIKDSLILGYKIFIHNKGISILKDLYDEIDILLSNNFGSVSNKAKVDQTAKQIKDYIDAAIEAIRNSLSEASTKNRALTSKQFKVHMMSFSEKLKAKYKTKVDRILVEVSVTNTQPGNIDISLVNYIQDFIEVCIPNSIEHGKSKNISLDINFDDKRCYISVIDDGKGFSNLEPNVKKNLVHTLI